VRGRRALRGRFTAWSSLSLAVRDLCCELPADGHAWPTVRGLRQRLSVRTQAPENSAGGRVGAGLQTPASTMLRKCSDHTRVIPTLTRVVRYCVVIRGVVAYVDMPF
jgi:hypothetical protein